MKKDRIIGILGGMGPEASANIYKKMIEYTQHAYNAVQDSEYPPIIIYSLPLDDFDETGITDEKSVKKQLVEGVQKLESAGCEAIVIACNTVHIFYSEMQEAVDIPILSIIDATMKKVVEDKYRKVGLFASEDTNKLNLYQKALSSVGVKVISANKEQQQMMNMVIEHVMGNNQKVEDTIVLKDIARSYLKEGAQAIILGCTEIPLAINQAQTDIKLFDTNQIIAKCAVDFSLSN